MIMMMTVMMDQMRETVSEVSFNYTVDLFSV